MLPVIPKFTRWAWASQTERQWWMPLFGADHLDVRQLATSTLAITSPLRKEVAGWPFTASRLFGIAEWVSPALKITHSTVWTDHIARWDNATGHYAKPEPWLWTDNGFKEPAPMQQAHATLLMSLAEEVPQGARVLDLGCGNGLLMRLLKQRRPDIKIAGVDTNAAAIGHIPLLSGKWYTNTIASGVWQDWQPTYLVVSLQRLIEDPSLHLVTGPAMVYGYRDCDFTKSAALGLSLRMLQHTPSVTVGVLDDAETSN